MSQASEHDRFFPSGAIAFFVVMVLFYAGLWFVLYLLMTQRG